MSDRTAARDTVVRALMFDVAGRPRLGGGLLRHDPVEVALILPVSGEPLVVRAVTNEDAAALAERLADLRLAAHGSTVGVLVLGGGAAIEAEIVRVTSMTGPLLVLHRRDDGRLVQTPRISLGARWATFLPPIQRALEQAMRADVTAELTGAEQAMLAVAPAAPDPEHDRFWAAQRARRPWATISIGVAIGLMFLLELACGGATSGPVLYRAGANVRDRVLAGEVWRLWSSAFLHIGVAHLLLNGWALRVFGPFLEGLLGSARFVLLYGVAALAGSLASVAAAHTTMSAGASGALWGLMVASYALALRPRGVLPDSVARAVRKEGWLPLVVNTLFSFTPGIDLYAHFGGGLAGGALALAGLLTARREHAPTLRATRAAGVVIAAGMAGSLVIAVFDGRPWEVRWPPRVWSSAAIGDTGMAMDVPPGYVVRTLTDAAAGVRSGAVGQPGGDPLYVMVSVADDPAARGAATPADDPLAGACPPASVIVAPPRSVVVGARPATFAAFRDGAQTVRCWRMTVDHQVVSVGVYSDDGTAAGWIEAAERFPATLRRR